MVCKDEHLAAIVQNLKITVEEIASLPHANNIMLKEYAKDIFGEYQKILKKFLADFTDDTDKNSEIPF